jgi:HlyD family secretion protein
MNNDNKYFDVREKVELEIHTMKPSWWMENGNLVAFLMLLLIFCFGYIVRYPDRIYGEFRLSSSQPAITIPLAPNAQIDKVFKTNGSAIRIAEPVLLFKNPANYNHILGIDVLLQRSISADSQFVGLFEDIKDQKFLLGEIQPFWMELYSSLFEHYTLTVIQKFDLEIERLRHQLDKQDQLGRKLKGMLKMNLQEKEIFKKYAFIDSVLSAQGVISTVDHLRKEEEYIAKDKDWQQQEISYKRNELEALGLKQAIDALAEEKRESLLRVRFRVLEAATKLRSEIETWKRKYLIESPIDGTLYYLSDVGENNFTGAEAQAIIITPREQTVKAVLKIPFQRAGKISKGQQVHFKLYDYPYREYGYLEGELSFISNVAGLNYYLGEVNLGKILKTNYHRTLLIKENMSGVAEIITDDRNILSRVFDRLFYIFRN